MEISASYYNDRSQGLSVQLLLDTTLLFQRFFNGEMSMDGVERRTMQA